MQIDTDGLSARIDDLVDHLERPRDTTLLRVLETQGRGRRNRDRRHLGSDAGVRRRRVLQAHGRGAPVPRCACGRGHGADRRRAARVHRARRCSACRCSDTPQRPGDRYVGSRRSNDGDLGRRVAYDPKVVTIWEGMRRYFLEEAQAPGRGRAVPELRGAGQRPAGAARRWHRRESISAGTPTWPISRRTHGAANACRPIAMRDTDIGWMTKIVAATGGPVAALHDLRGRTLALGSRDSGHAAILPVHFTRARRA